MKKKIAQKIVLDSVEVKKLKGQISKLKKAMEALTKANGVCTEAYNGLVELHRRRGLNE